MTVTFLRRYGRCVAVLRFDPFTDIDAIITDRGLPVEMQNELRVRDLKLVLV